MIESRGIKCLICNKRHQSANNGGKFTCDICRDFLMMWNHYFIEGETADKIIETRDEYIVRMRDVLDDAKIGTVRKAI